MSDFGISGAAPQLQALVATKLKQPDMTAQAAAVRAVGTTTDQISTALAAISSGVNIQV
jgi:hypothetical protein